MYAMDARQYDPAIARWIVQDPVTHHSQSPYCSFDNNPVFWSDPGGATVEQGTDYLGREKFDRFGMYIAPMDRAGGDNGSSDNGDSSNGGDSDTNSNNSDSSVTFKGEMAQSFVDALQQNPYEDDIVAKTTIIYKALVDIGIKNPNSRAAKSYESIQKILKSPLIQKLMKGSKYELGKNLIIDFQSKSLSWYGSTSPEDGKMYINNYTAFTTWARLAMTVTHEGLHRRSFLDKSWNTKSEMSTWKYEVKAWNQNTMLGDPIGKEKSDYYQSLINASR